MTVVILALFACSSPRWTEVGAVAPTLARIDADGDREVSEAEYAAVDLYRAPFSQADGDGDGTLSNEELLAVVLASDPSRSAVTRSSPGKRKTKKDTKTSTESKRKPKARDAPDARRTQAEAQWVVRMVLESLRDEVRAVKSDAAVPSDERVKAAAATADVRTAESRVVLGELEAASDAVGVGFPASLRAATLATVPVTPTPAVEELPPPGPERPVRQAPGG